MLSTGCCTDWQCWGQRSQQNREILSSDPVNQQWLRCRQQKRRKKSLPSAKNRRCLFTFVLQRWWNIWFSTVRKIKMHLKVIIYYSRRVKKCWLVSFSFAEVCFHLHQSPTLLFLLFSIQRVSADFAAGSRKIAGSLDYGVTSPGLCGWRKDSVRSAIFPVLCMVRVVNFPRPSQDLQNSWIWATVKNSYLSPQIWLILSSNVTKTCNYCFIALLTKELRRHSILCWITSVPTPPGKSWFSFCKISRSWKKGLVLEILLKGPGKSWNFIGYDVGGGHTDAGAHAKIYED